MDKGEIAFFITGLLFTLVWIMIFSQIGVLYFIAMSLYACMFFLILGYIDFKKESKFLKQ